MRFGADPNGTRRGPQGLHTEVSDFQNKLLAPIDTPCGAYSRLLRAKTEPVVTRPELNGAVSMSTELRLRSLVKAVLTSVDFLQMTQRAVELSITP